MRITIAALLICFALGESHAQDQHAAEGRGENDIATLQSDIKALNLLLWLLQPNRPTSLSVRGELFKGASGARVAIIEYADFECPYCGEYERQTFPQLLSNYIKTGKVKFFYRDLPLPIHPHAMSAARAARCAGEQGKYWEMHDSLFAAQGALSDPALLNRARNLGLDSAEFTECFGSDKYAADIRKNISSAELLQIKGTPTFFIGTVDDDVVTIKKAFQGAPTFEVFKASLDALLASNGLDTVSFR